MSKPNEIKRAIRGLSRQIEAEQDAWPENLKRLACRALLGLRTLESFKATPLEFHLSYGDVAAFEDAYAAHMARDNAI